MRLLMLIGHLDFDFISCNLLFQGRIDVLNNETIVRRGPNGDHRAIVPEMLPFNFKVKFTLVKLRFWTSIFEILIMKSKNKKRNFRLFSHHLKNYNESVTLLKTFCRYWTLKHIAIMVTFMTVYEDS